MDLTVGTHTVRLRHEAEERTLSVNMTAGAQMSQYLELGPPNAPAAPVGHLTIVSEPPGARVSINGEARGVTPVTVRDLEATPHKVTVVGATGSSERTVDVEPGGTTSVVFALGRPGVTAGVSLRAVGVRRPDRRGRRHRRVERRVARDDGRRPT